MAVNRVSLARQDIEDVIDAIEVVPRHDFQHRVSVARRRIPRDPNDWPTVALALALGADILTNDHDFLGCGCPTWTFETLSLELAAHDLS
jgi:predicted nucleic acid-binding protein